MKNSRIAIIDSGLSSSSNISKYVVDSYVLQHCDTGWEVQKSQNEDYIGHGTAVSHIIWETNHNIDIILFRICETELEIDENGLICILEFIYDNINVDIINISAGITHLYNYHDLSNICSKLTDSGVIIVSAFDNDGAISFPAALDCVVGVDVIKDNKKSITFVRNGVVNILVTDKYYRTEWINSKTIIKGTSFACAYISGLLSLQLNDCSTLDLMLHKICDDVVNCKKKQPILKPRFDINKAIVFPINKESHALLRFRERLKFEIVGAYDDKLSGKVGKRVFGELIQSYDNIDWQDDFDTIILSCTSELSALTKRNYVAEIINKANYYGKNIYSFEQLPCYNNNIFYPLISQKNVPFENNLKLYKSIIPTVCIVGTSSKQGKFTMQQKIMYQLCDLGYNVGLIATEPSGYLFDSDYVFHFGYNANLNLYPFEYIAILNKMSFGVQLKNKDILLTSCQSGVIHYNNSNINEFAISQYSFLLGTLPDVFVLCINPHDSIEYIKKTINFLNSIDEGKVKAIVIFPMKAVSTLSGIGYKIKELDNTEISELKQNLEKELDLPIFSMDNEAVSELCSLIIEEFTDYE